MKNLFPRLLSFLSGAITMACALLMLRGVKNAPRDFWNIFNDPNVGVVGFVLLVIAGGFVTLLWIDSERRKNFSSNH